MKLNELEAVLDIVNREIAEEDKLNHFVGIIAVHFSMDNPEKQEWIKRLGNRGIILTDITKNHLDPAKLKPYTGAGDAGIKKEGRGPVWYTGGKK